MPITVSEKEELQVPTIEEEVHLSRIQKEELDKSQDKEDFPEGITRDDSNKKPEPDISVQEEVKPQEIIVIKNPTKVEHIESLIFTKQKEKAKKKKLDNKENVKPSKKKKAIADLKESDTNKKVRKNKKSKKKKKK